MFDIGGWEFLVIVVVALVVIGPKDLPVAIRTVSAWMAKARELAREFRGGLDELQREVEFDRIAKDVKGSIGAEEIERTAHTIRNEVDDAGRQIAHSADASTPGKDPWEESYSYFENQPDGADDVAAQARRALELAEAEEGAADAPSGRRRSERDPSSEPQPDTAVPAPSAPAAGAGSRSGG